MSVKFHTWWCRVEPELLSGPTALNNLPLGSLSGKNAGFEVRFKKWLYIEITESESILHMRKLGPIDNGLPETPPCSHCQNKKPSGLYTSLEEYTPLNQSLQAEGGLFCLCFCFQCGYHQNQTRPTWVLLIQLPFTSPWRNNISCPPTNVSTKDEKWVWEENVPNNNGGHL